MIFTRRELSALLPSFFAAPGAFADSLGLPSKCYSYDSLTAKTNPETHNQARGVLDGQTHTGLPIELHITTLAAGQMPHPPHQHVHEEIIMLQEGALEVTILGQSTRIGPGSIAYVRSNDLHGWKNVGTGPAQYFVLAIGKDTA
ncbi:MAG: cupin domain-containing protein [Bryobacteraceae bacterium]